MKALLTFALSNFTLTFTAIGLIVAGIQIRRTPAPRPAGLAAEALLRWFLFFGIGCSFLYNFVCHVFLGDMSARFIGWAQSPFQAEVGWASLGFAVLGFMASRGERGLKTGTVAAFSCFMLGAAYGHVVQMITVHDFAPGNAGIMFWSDLLMPAFGWVLIALTRPSDSSGGNGPA